MFNLYTKVKNKTRRFRRHWLTIAFILGFAVDNITLNRVDQVFDNIVLLTYIVLAMLGLLALYASTAGKLPERIREPSRNYAPLLVQYAFGGLLSGMLIFYSRSGTLYDSWPFILLILAVIYGNEVIRDRAQRLVFNLAVLFVGMFSYIVLAIPVLIGMMGPWIFVGSGLIALMIMYGFFRVLNLIVPNFIQMQMRSIVFTIGIIFVSLNFLYFANIIPPIPLSLKDIGIYHNIVRFDNGDYQLTYEKPLWWEFFKDSDNVFHYTSTESVYCFASVFAPTRLQTDIYYKWERYNTVSEKWEQHDRFSYPIEGGRGNGFRGYTLIQNYTEGEWRCTVETERGQVVGRKKFIIEKGLVPELVDRID